MATPEPKRLVKLSPAAARDLAQIVSHTAAHWGVAQSENYLSFLTDAMALVAEGELFSRPLAGRRKLRIAYAKWPTATYGHYIIYSEKPTHIVVVRILHGSMDIRRHF